MSRRLALRLLVGVLIVAAVATVYLTPLRDFFTRANIRNVVGYLRDAWYGPPLFILVYALGCVAAVPASVFVIAAGFIWGWLLGGTYALIGALLGATASFFVARFVGEGLIHRFGRVGRAVAKQVDHAGFKSLLVLRLIPGIPFAVLNYGAGVAGVRLLDFAFATVLALVPTTYVFAYCADALLNGTMSEGAALTRLLTAAALMLAMVALPAVLKRFIKVRPTEE